MNTQVPSSLIAGDSLAWERELADYPAGVWTLTYYFSSGEASFNLTATASGTKHVIAATAAATGVYKAGRYRWHARATDGTTTETIDNGWLEIKPNPATAGVDWRSHARKMVDAIESALEGKASKNQLDLISYSIGGTVNVSRDRDQLMKLRSRYYQELALEEGAGGGNPRHVYLRFTRP